MIYIIALTKKCYQIKLFVVKQSFDRILNWFKEAGGLTIK